MVYPTTMMNVKITWKQVGNYKLELSLMERQGGTDWTSFYYNTNQDSYIGGHQSHITGNVLASLTLEPIHTGVKDTAICAGQSFTYGNPLVTFTESTPVGGTLVPFYNSVCSVILDRLDTLNLTVYPDVPVPTVEDVEYCLNEPAVALAVTPDTGYKLEWSLNGTDFSEMTNPIPATDVVGTTDYYVRQVRIDEEFGTYCYGNAATISVTVHELPAAPQVTTPVEYCVGGTAIALIAVPSGEGYTLQWSTDDTNFSVMSAPVPATTAAGDQIYYVRQVNNATGCIGASSSITVTVFALPKVTATADPDAICVGQSSELTAAGADDYVWNNELGTDASVTVSPLTTTTYTVTGTENHNLVSCSNTATVTVTVNPLPEITITTVPENATICSGGPVSLTAAAGADMSYLWSTEETNATIDSIIVNAGTAPLTVTYTVTATNNETGCTATASQVVTVNPLPIAAITPSETAICFGGSTQLVASDEKEYDEIFPVGADFEWSTGETTSSITVNPATDSTYSVIVTNQYGCTASASATVTVNPLPEVTLNAAPATMICLGDTVELSATEDYDYVWSANAGSATTASVELVPAATDTYTVTATDKVTGCTNTSTITVTVNPLPEFTVTPASQEICYGQSATFTATGSYNFLWSPGGETSNEITVSPAVGEYSYSVVATNPFACTAIASATLKVNPLPSVSYDFVPNDSICSGVDLTITANAGPNMFYDWLISSGTGPILHVTPLNFTEAPITNYYEIYVRDTVTGCNINDIVPVVIIPQPKPEITASSSVICSDTTAVLDADIWETYSWSTGSHNQTITVNEQGNYSVTITDQNGCHGVDTFFLTVNQIPDIVITTNPENGTVCNGQTALIAASAGSGMSYLWDNGQTSASFTTPALINNGAAPLTYTYKVTATNTTTGCTATSSVTITVNPRPDAAIVTLTDTICAGDALALTADDNVNYTNPSIITTYEWSTNTGYTTETPITVYPVSNITYSLTATNSYGCTGSTSANIVVNQLPTPEIVGNAAICADVTTNILALSESYSSYRWSTTETDATINAIDAGTYSVTVTDANGCVGSDDFDLIVNSLPVFNLTVENLNDSVCSGVNVTITANSTEVLSYHWSTGDNGASIDTVLFNSGTYTFYVTATNIETGCISTGSQSVTVNALPVAEITSNATNNMICYGQSVTLTATGGISYVWSNDSTEAEITLIPDITDTYFVTVTNGFGCTATASITITVNPLPNVAIETNPENGQICVGENITLTATGGAIYLWSTEETTEAITVSPASSQMYYVTATTALGCTATSSALVTVNSLPVVELAVSPNDTICSGGNIHIYATNPSGINFLWDNGSTNSYLDTILIAAGSHTFNVVGTDESTGCRKNSSITIYVNATPAPDLTIDHSASSICYGNTVTLSGPAGYAYLWMPGAQNTQSIELSGLSVGKHGYSLTITDTVTNCQNTTSDTITVNPLPEADIQSDKIDDEICLNGTIKLIATGGVQYNWSDGLGNNDTVSVSPVASQYYYVTVTNQFNCTDIDSIYVTVNALPTVVITPADTAVCYGQSAQFTASGAVTYSWITNPILVTPERDTTYTVMGTDANGCTNTATATIEVNPIPQITITVNPNDTVCYGTNATITASAQGENMSYAWETGQQVASFDTLMTATTTFMVTVTDAIGCLNTASKTVTVLALPSPSVMIDPSIDTICSGHSTVLSGPAGYDYNWSTSAIDTLQTITVSPLTTTTYTLTITDPVTTCQNSASATVTVLPLPVITFTTVPNDTICSGTDITITANAGANKTYNWLLTSQTGPILHATPLNNTSLPKTEIFIVEATDTITGCVAVDTQSVVVMPLPHPVITTVNDTICAGQSTVLDAGAGYMYYDWSPGDSTTRTISVTATGTYYVTVTDLHGCEADTNFFVQVNPVPVIVLTPSPNDTVCNGATVQIQANAGAGMTYAWSTGGTSNIITLTNLTNLTDNPISNDYSVVATNTVTGCTASATQTIIVNPTPIASIITLTDEICYGDSIRLTADDAREYTVTTTYLWSTGSTATYIIRHGLPVGNNIFGLTATNSYGCTNSTSATITVYALPTPEITGDSIICSNVTTNTLDAGAGYSEYEWSPNSENTQTVNAILTDDYSVTVTDNHGCKGSDVFAVLVNPSYSFTDEVTICDNLLPYSYGDSTFTAAGTYPVHFTLSTGCDSLVTLTLNVNPTYNHTDEVTICDNLLPYSYGDSTFTAAGTYPVHFTLSTGCDSLVTLTLNVNPTYNHTDEVTICDNLLPYSYGDSTFTAAGTYPVHFTLSTGCDSLVTLTLNVNPTYNHTDEVTICDNLLPYSYGDSTFTAAGTYPVHFTLSTGCDSLVTLTLNVNPTYNHTDEVTICDNLLPYSYGDSTFTAAGTYPVHFTLSTGCDSLVTLTLNVNPTYNHTDEVTICDNLLPYSYGDSTFTAAGTYSVHFTLSTGCDSLVTLTLNVNPTYNHTDEVTICDNLLPYSYGDSTFTAAGTYPVHFTLSTGCDSLVTLTLNVNPTYNHTDEVTICDNLLPYSYGDSTFTAAGIYPVHFTLSTGCDSLVTLTLNVNPTYNHTDEVTICDNLLPYSYGDSTFTAAGIYPVHFTLSTGCDSLVTLTLNVNPTYNHTDEVTICDNLLPYSYGDSTFTAAGTYPVHFTLGTGCDSLVTLTLNVNPTYSLTDTVSICESQLPYTYGDSTFEVGSVTGTYPVHFTLSTGCDSLVTLTLNVNPLPNPTITATDDTICLNQSVTLSVATSTSYLWSNDSTTASIVVTPATAGDFTYYVTVTNEYSCSAMDTMNIHVDTLPVVTITGDDRACTGPIELTATPGYVNYNWDGVDSGAVNTFTTMVSDTAIVIVTDGNGCQSSASHSIVISATPYMDIYVENYFTGINTYTDEAVVNGTTNFDIVVNTCENLENRRVSIEYRVYRNDTLITTNMTPYVTNNSSISYDVNNTVNTDQLYFQSANDLYYDRNSIGSIPGGENDNPLTDRTYRLTWGTTVYNFEWFWLHFLDDRPISVRVANWTEPGEYRFEYTLVERQATDNWNLPYLSPNYEVGGHNANAIIATLAFRAITVTVKETELIAPTVSLERPVVPAIELPQQAATLEIYPNPNSTRVVNLKLSNLEGKTIVNIVNMSGKVVESHELNLSSKDESIYTYSLDDYAQGIYFVTIINNDAVLTKKLIIQK